MVRGQALVGGGGLSHDLCQVEGFRFGLVKALLQPGRLAHALEDAAQAVGSAAGPVPVTGLFVVAGGVLQVVQGGTDHRHRGLEFVGQAAGEAFQVVGITLQALDHLAELAVQLPQLVPGPAPGNAGQYPAIGIDTGIHRHCSRAIRQDSQLA